MAWTEQRMDSQETTTTNITTGQEQEEDSRKLTIPKQVFMSAHIRPVRIICAAGSGCSNLK